MPKCQNRQISYGMRIKWQNGKKHNHIYNYNLQSDVQNILMISIPVHDDHHHDFHCRRSKGRFLSIYWARSEFNKLFYTIYCFISFLLQALPRNEPDHDGHDWLKPLLERSRACQIANAFRFPVLTRMALRRFNAGGKKQKELTEELKTFDVLIFDIFRFWHFDISTFWQFGICALSHVDILHS